MQTFLGRDLHEGLLAQLGLVCGAGAIVALLTLTKFVAAIFRSISGALTQLLEKGVNQTVPVVVTALDGVTQQVYVLAIDD